MKEVFVRFSETLARTERMSLPDLARYQEQLLLRLLRHANEHLPFYRNRLACLFGPHGGVDLARWNEVPLLAREDVIARGDEMRVAELPADLGPITEARTSGSTGIPLRIATNGLTFVSANALLARAARWFGADPARPLAAIRRFTNEPPPPSPEGHVKAGWSLGHPDTPYYEIELLTPLEQQLAWLVRRRAPYLVTQASHALSIAHAVTPAQGRALGIEIVFAIGETVPDGARELVAERLGARLAGLYSCQEIGGMACECEQAPHYHVAAENALIEILDDDCRDVVPGGRGRVVVTGFYNYAMPFIRYVLGDVAVAGAGPCACGRTLPVIARIVGRTHAAFAFRDGSRLWLRGSLIRPMHEFVPFRRYQLVQHDHESIEFRYEPDGSGRAPDLAGLNALARKTIHPSVAMTVTEVDALRPGPSGKLEEFISLVAAPVGAAGE
jgi:phenylacetate-CoA ligase